MLKTSETLGTAICTLKIFMICRRFTRTDGSDDESPLYCSSSQQQKQRKERGCVMLAIGGKIQQAIEKYENLLVTGVVVTGGTVAIASGIFYFWVKSAPKGDPSLIGSDRELLREKYKSSKVQDTYDVIIIGSGMGGLSCGAILSRLGRRVLVLEQHDDVCGGGTHMFTDEKGYKFDSGLHYTVPWSVPVFALTCLKKPEDVTKFEIMGESDGTVDKIYLADPASLVDKSTTVEPFKMKYKETHLSEIYKQYPEEKGALDEYMRVSDNSMAFVKFFIFSRLLPKWMQDIYWKLVPSSVTSPVLLTAKELLPKLTNNKR